MTRRSEIPLRFLVCATALMLGAGLAQAGAPSPRPDLGEGHAPEHQLANLGAFTFRSGEVVNDFRVSYVTHGTLNAARDNVVLAMQHFIGDHHDLDFLIGPGKALDPERWYIVAPDFIANARLRQDLTSGPTNSGLRMEFPRLTTRDLVEADVRLLRDYLGIERVRIAIGASMGAMKAYQLAVSHPGYVDAIIPIAGSPVTNPQTRAQLRNMMRIVALDPGWYGGDYETNPVNGINTALTTLVPWWHTYEWFEGNLSTPAAYRDWELLWREIWNNLAPQDARDVYYQLIAWAEFDIGDSSGFDGDAAAALASIRARTLILAAPGDMLVRTAEIGFAADAIPGARVVEIDSDWGHLICCGFDPEATAAMDRAIADFLAEAD